MRNAFTMVELLVVLLILAILLSLVVGISKYVMAESAREQTKASQSLVLLAVEKYYDVNGVYPPADSDCKALLVSLSVIPVPKEPLLRLPNDAWKGPNHPLKDGFGEAMKFDPVGGLGGTPVLISKGPDRQFGTGDDIRSDK